MNIEVIGKELESRSVALKLYDAWVRQRQSRPPLKIPDSKKALQDLRLENFSAYLAEPRKEHLKQLKELTKGITTPDKVALLVSMELPALEISTLLQKLSIQLAKNSEAPYFSKINQSDNCGCGCGCGCAWMVDLPYEERINAHMGSKPYSIDPFNESGISEKERDALLVKDFLASYEKLAAGIYQNINQRCFNMARDFS